MHVEHFLDRTDAREHRVGGLLQQILALRRQRRVVEPAQVRFELLRRFRRASRSTKVSPRDTSTSSARTIVTVWPANARSTAAVPPTTGAMISPPSLHDWPATRRSCRRLHFAGLDTAHVAAEIVGLAAVLARHPLHRETQRLAGRNLDRQCFEQVQQWLARVPGHAFARSHDVVALERRHRHEAHVGQTQLTREFDIRVANFVERARCNRPDPSC